MTVDEKLFSILNSLDQTHWSKKLREIIQKTQETKKHGHIKTWKNAINGLPIKEKRNVTLNESVISVKNIELNDTEKKITKNILKELRPWRKGPFSVDEIFIDSEWKSNMKWDRVKSMVSSLDDKTVLDVGCGNGYYSFRMIGEGAKLVIGIDPSDLFMMQFRAITHFINPIQLYLLRLRLQDLPSNKSLFDAVFSMGILYHQKSHHRHLSKCAALLKPGGELVLETIIFPGMSNFINSGNQRYSQMRNVWYLPNLNELVTWLKIAGFTEIKLGSINRTSIEEQRSTEWMTTQSLIDGLDPENHDLTIEGYPAPHRIVVVCKKYH